MTNTTTKVHHNAESHGAPALTEDEVREAVEGASVPVLLMVLYQVTGDESWIGPRFAPSHFRGVSPRPTGDIAEADQRVVRDAAVDAIASLLAHRRPVLDLSDVRDMEKAASFFLGEPIDRRYAAILTEELRRRSADSDEQDDVPDVTPPAGTRAIVIGMGISGLAAIHLLQQLGIEFTVFERGADAGGVWHQNRYPGAGVDTPSHLYSFSFDYRDWDRHFELRDELYEYFNGVLDSLDARTEVSFETEVVSAVYDDDSALWTVTTRNREGELDTHVANMVISGVGSLNQPKLPSIAGREEFEGLQFHSNRWPDGLDLTGKRVAIVGAGASSQQISPSIAPIVEHLDIVQRSPQWVAPFEQFREEVPTAERTLLQHLPLYRAWNWIGLFYQHGDKIIDALRVDPSWPHPERSVNRRNDRQREFLTKYIESALEGRPDLIEKAVPDYPPFGKRMLLDNGWYRTLKRENVDLFTSGVSDVTRTGLTLSTGERLDVDVIIWATGFEAARFLSSLEVRGEEGLDLSEAWDDDDPRAYLGVSIPHFPNFFMLGGPHSLPGSGSFMYFMELQARYLRDLLAEMFRKNITAISATEDSTNQYNELVDTMHSKTVWTHPGFATYYRNSKGRVIFVMPFLNVEYWEMVRRPDLSDFDILEDAAVQQAR
ncbi:monooxygenase [Rhodococcus sp. 05-2254-5]|jgi:4-hydroxyacetophenone monooxygenase|uniref:flavin-containing monooxygenase n=1 Tax=unclassified Rhodococcus (in: high G+C Gram-positive bacteria) TaxID=192944 RepID=UPI000B9A33CC|nr:MULTISPECIES: NAD(P)/FAD-dependent oxidoreductase [unclassified Rhodococcus (in: high G+C Gram-positive bacteria)]OZE26735.1 monooxygenase [Rhodococcus sp. 05-2254-5]OZE52715.1 monooxygenase [Rhodococcus sp. 05-2254-1]